MFTFIILYVFNRIIIIRSCSVVIEEFVLKENIDLILFEFIATAPQNFEN